MEEGESHFLAGVLSIALLTLACTPVRAQVLFGSVVGAVTDASGAAVPGATVKITNVQTSNKRTAQTDTGGAYTISTVPAGLYLVNIRKEGFENFGASNAQVIANNVIRVDARLQVGPSPRQ